MDNLRLLNALLRAFVFQQENEHEHEHETPLQNFFEIIFDGEENEEETTDEDIRNIIRNINPINTFLILNLMGIFSPVYHQIPTYHDYYAQDGSEQIKSHITKETFDSFKEKNHDSTCAICLETNNEGTVTELPCKHYFHKECISKWLLHESTKCPMCKKNCQKKIIPYDNKK